MFNRNRVVSHEQYKREKRREGMLRALLALALVATGAALALWLVGVAGVEVMQ